MGNNYIWFGYSKYKEQDVINSLLDKAEELYKEKNIDSIILAKCLYNSVHAISNEIEVNTAIEKCDNKIQDLIIEAENNRIKKLEQKIEREILERRREIKDKTIKFMKIFGIVVVVLAVIFGIYSCTYNNFILPLQVAEKERKEQQSLYDVAYTKISTSVLEKSNLNYYYSYNGIVYVSNVKIRFKNNNSFQITSLKGYIQFSDITSNEILWEGTLSYSDDIFSYDSVTCTFKFESQNSKLYEQSLNTMLIKFKITDLYFENYKSQNYSNLQYTVIYRGSTN